MTPLHRQAGKCQYSTEKEIETLISGMDLPENWSFTMME